MEIPYIRQIDKLNRAKEANALAAWKPEPQSADVDIDTFGRCDIRVGTVLECKRVPKAEPPVLSGL